MANGEAQSRGLPVDGDGAERAAELPDRRPRAIGPAVPAGRPRRRGGDRAHAGPDLGEPPLRLSPAARDAAARGAGREPQTHLAALQRRGPAGAHEEAPQAAPARSHRPAGPGAADAALVARLHERSAGRLPAVPDPEHRRRSQPVLPGPDRRPLDLRRPGGAVSRRAGRAARAARGDRPRQRRRRTVAPVGPRKPPE